MPIEQLPAEIIIIILELVCTQNLFQEYQYQKAHIIPEEPPTTLCSPVITYLPAQVVSAVCMRWRTLSLALPGLWAQLKLEIVETVTASNGIMGTLQLYLERSAEAPLCLDIFIGCNLELDGDFEDVNPPPLDLLLQHTSRWKTFRCITDLNMSKTPLFLPILEDLTLQWVHDETSPDTYHCFQHVPMLRVLNIREGSEIERGLSPRLPLHQLTTLIMSSLSYSELHSVVGDLHNLTTLEVSIIACEDQTIDLSVPLAQLKSFTLSLEYYYDAVDDNEEIDWFHIFTFPSLDKLVVSRSMGAHEKFTWSANAFSNFLSRSSCTLTHLSINGIAISDLDFIAALQLLPSLTSLGFSDCPMEEKTKKPWWRDFYGFRIENPITSFFLSNFTIHDSVSDSGPVLVPKLQSLSIKIEGTSFDDVSFVEMVLSRWLPDPSYTAAGVASLRSLVLRLHEQTVDEDIYRPLFELDKVGMRWGREVEEEADLRPLGNLERMGMRVVITGKEYSDLISTQSTDSEAGFAFE